MKVGLYDFALQEAIRGSFVFLLPRADNTVEVQWLERVDAKTLAYAHHPADRVRAATLLCLSQITQKLADLSSF